MLCDVGRLSIVCGVLGLGLGLGGCQSATGPTGPPPDLRVVQATDIGTLRSSGTILGRDGGYSGVFAGNSVWLFGDTFLAHPNAQGRTLISDSWSWTSDLRATDGFAGFEERTDAVGAPTMIIPETAAESTFNAAHRGDPCQEQPCGARWALWPGVIVADSARQRALIFYMLVYALPGPFNFSGVGRSAAIWSSFGAQPERPTIDPAAAHPDLLFSASDPGFGSSAFAKGDTLYVYGCNRAGGDKPCRLGRVPLAAVVDRSAWTFYAGQGTWSASVGDAVSVFSGNDILSVAWNQYLQRYVAVYSAPLSDRVMLRTSTHAEGPWSREVHAFTTLPASGGNTVYDALAHPEYDIDGGRIIYISYSRATGAFSSEVRIVAVELQPPLPTM
jgi:hypothetical protein